MIEIRRMEPRTNMHVYFKTPVVINERRKGKYWVAEFAPTNLYVLEKTIDDLVITIGEMFDCDYEAYALADDNTLTEKAKVIKRWFLENTFIKKEETE
jgi:hypothetical protein